MLRDDLKFSVGIYDIGTKGGFSAWYIANTKTGKYYMAKMENNEITEEQLALHALSMKEKVE